MLRVVRWADTGRLGRALRLLLGIGVLLGCASSPTQASAEQARAVTPEAASMTLRAADYLEQLVAEMNVRRADAGTQPLTLAPMPVNAAITQYVADLTPRILERQKCFHGDGQTVAPSWDYVAASGFSIEVGGEVLACPDTSGYWTPQKLAERWWRSESHRATLYVDGRANLIACGAFNPLSGGTSFQTIACTTFRG
jgi:hypothetical protein